MEVVQQLQIASEVPGRLACAAHTDAGKLVLELFGTAESGEEPLVAQLLERAHECARALHAREVEMDFTSLKFISSSVFKDFVAWLARVMALPPQDRYRIHFKSNPKFRWQRASLNALSCFAVELVTLE